MNDLQLTLPEGILHTTRSVSFPLQMSREHWVEYGRFLSRAKDGLTFWRSSWLDFGRINFGDEFVRESVAQLEFEFADVRKAQLLSTLPVRDPDLTAEHHFILAKSKLDDTGRDMWVQLAKKESLTASELQESIRLGRVEKASKAEGTGQTSAGIASWQAFERTWDLLMRQLGDIWQEWSPEEIAAVRVYLAGPVEFDKKLQGLAVKRAS